MTEFGLRVLVGVFLAAAVIVVASMLTERSYRRFLRAARGPVSTALPPGGPQTPLDALLDPLEGQAAGKNGLKLLLDATDAFAARVASAAQAGRSLDLMYFIWRTDLAGWLLIGELVAAADRGVRVRLLLDDVNVRGFNPAFLALSRHPMVEVRLFNPLRHRGHVPRQAVEAMFGMRRLNRRMHGKLWVADGRLAIIGGRNIGNTYFGADEGARQSIDADVMLVGRKVSEVAAVFDGFWNLGLSMPIHALWPGSKTDRHGFHKRLTRHVRSAASRRFMAKTIEGRSSGRILTEGLRWTSKVQFMADPPDKAYGLRSTPWLTAAIFASLASAQHHVRLITPYFVPGRSGIAELARLAARGVKVSLLTNALSVTDTVLVFGTYRHYRASLLAAGATVHEFARPFLPSRRPDVLHSKVFVIDGRRAIVGSPNFDLRSAFINTELALAFEEPDLVDELVGMFDALSAPDQAYALCLRGRALQWTVTRLGRSQVMSVDPDAGWFRRSASWIVGRLPIEAYL